MSPAAINSHVVIAIPVLFVGGTEIQTLDLVKVLKSGGYQVSVCCYYEYDDSMVQEIQAAGARAILMGLDRTDGLFHLARKLMGLFKELNPDIVHVQYIAPGLVPVVAARLSGISTVFATVHQPGHVYGRKAKLLVRVAARLCSAFFCNSRAVEESWFGDSALFTSEDLDERRRHFTVYNGVDIDQISEIVNAVDRNELKHSLGMGDNPVVGIVARLRSEKGHTILLAAMAAVIKTITDAMLLVVGDGPDCEELKKQASALGIIEHVVWLGQKTHREIFRLYAIMDVVAIPSLFEGFGFSAAEAMAAKLPVVGMRVDALAEVIEDGVSGCLVNTGDNRELAGAITDFLLHSQKAKAMGNHGYARVKEHFSIELFNKLMLSAYGSCS